METCGAGLEMVRRQAVEPARLWREAAARLRRGLPPAQGYDRRFRNAGGIRTTEQLECAHTLCGVPRGVR